MKEKKKLYSEIKKIKVKAEERGHNADEVDEKQMVGQRSHLRI